MAQNKRFLMEFADSVTSQAWLEREVRTAEYPPVAFLADNMSAHVFLWKKRTSEIQAFTDYSSTQWPAERQVETVIYTCEKLGLEIRTEITSYPDYPIVEYSSTLTNISEENSPRIQNLLSISRALASDVKKGILHSFKGDNCTADSYRPYADEMTDGKSHHFEDVTGRPLTAYLPNFNFEIPQEKRGVIAVLGWAGKWKADFTLTDGNLLMNAGACHTDFVLLPGESYKLPITVLLFYRGEQIDGQNIWRRWLYEHNILRMQGVRDHTRLLMCATSDAAMRSNAQDDLKVIRWAVTHGFHDLVDEFVQDAGWYDCKDVWYQVGRWHPDPERYPETLRVVSDELHKNGMQYRLWFEPERLEQEAIKNGTNTVAGEYTIGLTKDTAGNLIYNPIENYQEDVMIDENWCISRLVNYGTPEAVDKTIEYVNYWIDANGVDIYRQDFNIEPAYFWDPYDKFISAQMQIPRYGITEEKHISGYRKVWDSILERHSGMIIDSCGGGGRRNDLETIRYSEPHTRTDYWATLESTQNHTYGAAQWLVLMGGACSQNAPVKNTGEYDSYYWRSGTYTSRGFSIKADLCDTEYAPENIEAAKAELKAWKDFAAYVLYDFYPLTPYSTEPDAIMAFQYDSPEQGIGMVVTYLRAEVAGTHTVYPTHLQEKASYILHDEDGKYPDRTLTGAELMEQGITVTALEKPSAPYYTYRKI